MGVRISRFPHTDGLILACAMDNSKIDLYIEDGEFSHSLTLKGHEDWVRGLDFTTGDFFKQLGFCLSQIFQKRTI